MDEEADLETSTLDTSSFTGNFLSPPSEFIHSLPFIDEVPFNEWLRRVTDGSGPYGQGISVKDIRQLVDAQLRRKQASEEKSPKPYWRNKNQLCEILHREYKTGNITRISQGIYKGNAENTTAQKRNVTEKSSAPAPKKQKVDHSSKTVCKVCGRNVNKESTFFQCKRCCRQSHLICLRNRSMLPSDYLSITDFKQLKNALGQFFHHWICYDCKRCSLCGGKDDDAHGNGLLLCDRCDGTEHLNCQVPRPKEIPYAPWYCTTCKAAKISERQEPVEVAERKVNLRGEGVAECGTSSLESAADHARVRETVKLDKFGLPSLHNNAILKDCGRDVKQWNVGKAASLFLSMGYGDVAQVFTEQEIDGPALLLLTRKDVLYGMNLKLGTALKAYRVICHLQTICDAMNYERRERALSQSAKSQLT